MKKHILALSVCAALVLPCATPAGAAPAIYDMTKTEQIARGVSHEQIRRLTTSGWQTINVVRADLTKKHLELKLLTHPESIHKLSNVKTLAQQHNTIAAVNGDFFSWKSGASGHGSSVGIEIEDGALLSSPAESWEFSTFAQQHDGTFIYEYLDSETSITSPDGTQVEILHTNKYTDLAKPVLYDRHWGDTSIGSEETIVEMVIVDDVIEAINLDMGPVEIPEDGYVITFLSDQTPELIEHFQVGDKITLDTWYVPDFEDIRFAVGAGTILLKDGKKTEITHNVSGAQPRTAIGTDAAGETLYFVTVDGRQETAKGMTLPELADFLLEYGIENAVNLDGGGSTTLVARSPIDGENQVFNTPSEGSLRAVANGVGVISNAPVGKLDSFTLTPDAEYAFVGTKIALRIAGRDANYAPVEFDPSTLSWTASSGYVDEKELVYYPERAGVQTIRVTDGAHSGSATVTVLDNPARLELAQDTFELSLGGKAQVDLRAYTEDGYWAKLDLRNVDISFSNPKVAGITDNHIVAKANGLTVVTFSFDGVTANALVTVDAGIPTTDGFEAENGSFLPYPSYVGGAYKVLPDYKHDGKTAGKLWYDFRFEQDDLKSANLLFSDGGKRLASSADSITLWAYSDTAAPHAFKAMLSDANGQVHRVTISGALDWDGWKQFTVKMPENAARPLTLTRLYVVQNDPADQNAGAVYIDNLTFDGAVVTDTVELPENVRKPDPYHMDTDMVSGNDSFRFAVFGDTTKRNTLSEFLTVEKFKKRFPAAGEIAFFVGEHAAVPDEMPVKAVKTSGFNVFDYKDVTFLTLDNSGGSVVDTDATQWERFLRAAGQVNGETVFVFMPQGANFKNDYEKDLFYEVMHKQFVERGIAVHVVHQSEADVKAVNGIRFYSTSGVTGLSNANDLVQNADYLEFSVNDDVVTYQYKKVFDTMK